VGATSTVNEGTFKPHLLVLWEKERAERGKAVSKSSKNRQKPAVRQRGG